MLPNNYTHTYIHTCKHTHTHTHVMFSLCSLTHTHTCTHTHTPAGRHHGSRRHGAVLQRHLLPGRVPQVRVGGGDHSACKPASSSSSSSESGPAGERAGRSGASKQAGTRHLKAVAWWRRKLIAACVCVPRTATGPRATASTTLTWRCCACRRPGPARTWASSTTAARWARGRMQLQLESHGAVPCESGGWRVLAGD